jgi:hypothetical protein
MWANFPLKIRCYITLEMKSEGFLISREEDTGYAVPFMGHRRSKKLWMIVGFSGGYYSKLVTELFTINQITNLLK